MRVVTSVIAKLRPSNLYSLPQERNVIRVKVVNRFMEPAGIKPERAQLHSSVSVSLYFLFCFLHTTLRSLQLLSIMRLSAVVAAPLLLTATTLARSPLRRGQTTDTCANLDAELVFPDVVVDGELFFHHLL